MLSHIFRPSFSPSPITSISSNDSLVAVFRRNGSVDFLSSKSFLKFYTLEIFEEILRSFFNQSSLICLSKSGKIILLNTEKEISKEILDLSANNICKADLVSFYFSNIKNEVFLYTNNKAVHIATLNCKISSLVYAFGYLLIGTNDGWITVLQNGKVFTEIEIKTRPTKMIGINPNVFIIAGEDGAIYLINPISEVIIDRLHIRDHPLNDLVLVDGNIHASGVDSRLICISINKNKLIKNFQGDPHITEVLTMAKDGERILSGGEDCVLVVSTIKEGEYEFNKVYDRSMVIGQTKEHFYTTSNNSLDLYHHPHINDDIDDTIDEIEDRRFIFEIGKNVLENISLPRCTFNHFLSIKLKNKIIAASVSADQKYSCISTSKQTILYSLFTGSKLHIEELKTFPPAKWIGFGRNILVIQRLDLMITVFDLDRFESIDIRYDSLRENIGVIEDTIYFIERGILVDDKGKVIRKDEGEGDILAKTEGGDTLVYFRRRDENIERVEVTVELTQSTELKIDSKTVSKTTVPAELNNNQSTVSAELNNNQSTVPAKLNNNQSTVSAELNNNQPLTKQQLILKQQPKRLLNQITNTLILNETTVCSNNSHIFILDRDGNLKGTYEIGSLINGIASHKGNIVVIQSPYKKMSEKFKKSVFKEKYSNK